MKELKEILHLDGSTHLNVFFANSSDEDLAGVATWPWDKEALTHLGRRHPYMPWHIHTLTINTSNKYFHPSSLWHRLWILSHYNSSVNQFLSSSHFHQGRCDNEADGPHELCIVWILLQFHNSFMPHIEKAKCVFCTFAWVLPSCVYMWPPYLYVFRWNCAESFFLWNIWSHWHNGPWDRAQPRPIPRVSRHIRDWIVQWCVFGNWALIRDRRSVRWHQSHHQIQRLQWSRTRQRNLWLSSLHTHAV